MTDSRQVRPGHLALLGLTVLVLLWSGLRPKDGVTWLLEVLPVLLVMPLLAWTYHRFRLTDLLYVLITAHAVVLMVGGHYTYAEVPLGEWVRDAFDLGRNHYDRLGHFMQGLVPALVARELLARLGVLARRGWSLFICCCIALAISACYEFIEWWVALVSEEAAESFLGTQGDVWDTQWDMFLALCGAFSGQVALGAWHDRQLARLAARP